MYIKWDPKENLRFQNWAKFCWNKWIKIICIAVGDGDGTSVKMGQLSCCCCSVAKNCLFGNSWTVAHQALLFSTVSQSLLRFMSIDSVMLSNHLLLPSLFPSIRVFPNELALCIRWPKYYSFSFSNSHCNEYAGLISFRIDWFGVLAVSSPSPQFKSISSLTFSFLYGPTLTSIHDHWENQSFHHRYLCQLFNTMSRFVIAFLLRSKPLLISCL